MMSIIPTSNLLCKKLHVEQLVMEYVYIAHHHALSITWTYIYISSRACCC